MPVRAFYNSDMRSKRAVSVICVASLAFSMLGCTPDRARREDDLMNLAYRYTDAADIIVDLESGRTSDFYASDGYRNGPPFNCTWSAGNAVIADGVLSMSVTGGGNYLGAEYRSRTFYSYGYYSVCMKAAACSGVISSFFTYVGRPEWDEIDIEFLGYDTTRIQFNYYTSGVGKHEYVYELGFDGAADFHEYGFDWRPDCIIWYVDGKPVHKATENIPSRRQQIMMNVWNGSGSGFEKWCGKLDTSSLPATAVYKWVAYSPDSSNGANDTNR